MHLRVINLGKTDQSFVKEGVEIYLGRLKHYAKIEWIELDNKKLLKFPEPESIMKAEAQLIEKTLQSRYSLWLLDDKGKQDDSVGFANRIAKTQHTHAGIDMVIGGPYGFTPELKLKAECLVSLSKLTFTHQMVRVILAEQLYRAFTILKGEGYHHV